MRKELFDYQTKLSWTTLKVKYLLLIRKCTTFLKIDYLDEKLLT